MKKLIALCTAVLMLLIVAAGCGNNASEMRSMSYPAKMVPERAAHLWSCLALKRKTKQAKL